MRLWIVSLGECWPVVLEMVQMGIEVEDYAWLSGTAIAEAGCMGLVRNVDLAAVAWALGGDLAAAIVSDLEGIFDESIGARPVAALIVVGEWTLVVENNGWQVTRPEVLRKLSVKTEAIAWYWCDAGNLPPYLSRAVDGSITTTVSEWDKLRTGTQPNDLDEHLVAVGWDLEDTGGWISPMVATRVTGVTIRPEMLRGDLTVVPILPWPEDIPDTPEYSVGARYAGILADADESQLRLIARAAVKEAVERIGLTNEPDLIAVIGGGRGAHTLAGVEHRSRVLGPSGDWPRFRAYEAARACLSPDPMIGATHAIGSAEYALEAAKIGAWSLEDPLRRAKQADNI